MARKPANPELAVEAVLRERAAAARSAIFTIPLGELLKASGLGPGATHRVVEMVLKVCSSNGYRLVKVYAKKGKCLQSLRNVEVIPHSRSLLVFKKRGRCRAVAVKRV